MVSNMSIRKCRERIVWCMFGLAAIIVLLGLGIEFFKHYHTNNTTTVYLQDASKADVLVILSSPVNENAWIKINTVVNDEAMKSDDMEYLNTTIMERLIELGYPVVAFSIDRQKIVIYTEEGSKSP